MENIKYDVFLSRKSEDAHMAKEIYDFLTEKGLKVFDSDHSLQEMGNADYSKAIDEALVNSMHLIVVGSSVENINSPWVESEWRFFLNRKRSGKVKGNLLSIILDILEIDDLPPSLQNYQVIYFNNKQYERIFSYVKSEKISISKVANSSKSSKEDVENNIKVWLEKSEKAISNQNFEEAFKLNLLAAKAGNCDAEFNLSLFYSKGEGVNKDEKEAFKWLKKAAEQGQVYAQYNLGTKYANGQHIEKNDIEAFKWYSKAAFQGFSEAEYNLGLKYENGIGTKENISEAIKWYFRAAMHNHTLAQNKLGICYEHGIGVEYNLEEAVKWHKRAGKNGNLDSQYTLGFLFFNGIGKRKNEKEAEKWYLLAANQGDLDAQNALTLMSRK